MKKIAVLEKAVSFGAEAPVTNDIKSALYDEAKRPEIRSFTVGLGGRDVTIDNIKKIYDMVKTGKGKSHEWVF